MGGWIGWEGGSGELGASRKKEGRRRRSVRSKGTLAAKRRMESFIELTETTTRPDFPKRLSRTLF